MSKKKKKEYIIDFNYFLFDDYYTNFQTITFIMKVSNVIWKILAKKVEPKK